MASLPTAVQNCDLEAHVDLKQKVRKWIRDVGFDFVAPNSRLDFLRFLSNTDEQINRMAFDIGL